MKCPECDRELPNAKHPVAWLGLKDGLTAKCAGAGFRHVEDIIEKMRTADMPFGRYGFSRDNMESIHDAMDKFWRDHPEGLVG